MSNRPKGIWGQNPTRHRQYQRRPSQYRKADVSDGCAGILVWIIASVLFMCVCRCTAQPANFVSKTACLQPPGGQPEWYDAEMQVVFSGDTAAVVLRSGAPLLIQPGVTWIQATEQIWTAAGDGYYLLFAAGRRGNSLEIRSRKIGVLTLYQFNAKTQRL